MPVLTVKDKQALFYHTSHQIERVEKSSLIERLYGVAEQYPNLKQTFLQLAEMYQGVDHITKLLPCGQRMFVFLVDLLIMPSQFSGLELNAVYLPRILDQTVHSALHDDRFGNTEHYPRMAQRHAILLRDESQMSQSCLLELYGALFFVFRPEILLGSVVEKDRPTVHEYMRVQTLSWHYGL